MSSVVVAYGDSATRCNDCGGIFCRKKTLELLQKLWVMWPSSDPRTIDTGTTDIGREWNALAEVSCPSCDSPMLRTAVPEQPHIEIERCPACEGVFFDAGELTDLRYVTLVDFIRKLLHSRKR
jgi:uncharacterized C2H2 Zn-finger protein